MDRPAQFPDLCYDGSITRGRVFLSRRITLLRIDDHLAVLSLLSPVQDRSGRSFERAFEHSRARLKFSVLCSSRCGTLVVDATMKVPSVLLMNNVCTIFCIVAIDRFPLKTIAFL